MMQFIKLGEGQAVIDIAMQELGDVERLFELCLLNDVNITDELEPGTVFTVPDFATDKKRVVAFFSDKTLAPASIDDLGYLPMLPPGGVGWMQVGSTFISS